MVVTEKFCLQQRAALQLPNQCAFCFHERRGEIRYNVSSVIDNFGAQKGSCQIKSPLTVSDLENRALHFSIEYQFFGKDHCDRKRFVCAMLTP
jgi:hypothetical protein